MFLSPHCPVSLLSSIHAKDQKAEEHSDPHQGDGGRSREKLTVIDPEIPDQCQHDHKDWYHQVPDGRCEASVLLGSPS